MILEQNDCMHCGACKATIKNVLDEPLCQHCLQIWDDDCFEWFLSFGTPKQQAAIRAQVSA